MLVKTEERSMDFRDLEVWKKAHQLTLQVYRATEAFPKEEKYRLVDQLCRAASSVPANIVYPVKYITERLLHGVNPVK